MLLLIIDISDSGEKKSPKHLVCRKKMWVGDLGYHNSGLVITCINMSSYCQHNRLWLRVHTTSLGLWKGFLGNVGHIQLRQNYSGCIDFIDCNTHQRPRPPKIHESTSKLNFKCSEMKICNAIVPTSWWPTLTELQTSSIETDAHCAPPSLSPQTSVVPPAGVVVWEMRAGHTGIWMHHVSQLWCGHWELCASAGARTQALLQRGPRAGQLGKTPAVRAGDQQQHGMRPPLW